MTDVHARLLAARDVLNRAERAVGLRARNDIEHVQAGTSPVLLEPTGRAELIRLLIDICPSEGWIGVHGVRNIGWGRASQQGMDLGRVLVLNAGKDHQAGGLCPPLIEARDVVCLDIPELSGAQQRTLAARARSMGRTIVTLRPWPGLSREAPRRRMQLVVQVCDMVVRVPDWPVHCLMVDLPPGGTGAVVYSERIEVVSDAARSAGVRSGMSVREATYVCPDLTCLPRDPDREARAFSAVVDTFDSVAAGVERVRPGMARYRTCGPAHWHESEEAAALALVSAIEETIGVECFVGIADGPVASLEAACEGRIAPAGENQLFLGRIPLHRALWAVPVATTDRAADAIELSTGLGVHTRTDLLALGRGRVCERFGDVGEQLWNLASGGDSALTPAGRIQPDITMECVIGADGGSINTMIVPIQRIARDLSQRLGWGGLVSQTLRIDVEDVGGGQRTRAWSGCDVCVSDGVALRVRWTLAGWTSGIEGPSGVVTCIRVTACDPRVGRSASALWGRSDRERDASRSVVRIQRTAGPNSLLIPRVQGGYDPRSHVVMTGWGSKPLLRPHEGVWEGRIAHPPATLFDEPVRVRIVGASGAYDDVRVDYRGALNAAPAYLVSEHDVPQSVSGGGRRTAIAQVEEPWPVEGRWWVQERPRAYMRALFKDGRDVLLVWKEGEWVIGGLPQ